jgi:hypothetical protein
MEVNVDAFCNPGNSREAEDFGNQNDLDFVILQSFLLFCSSIGL